MIFYRVYHDIVMAAEHEGILLCFKTIPSIISSIQQNNYLTHRTALTTHSTEIMLAAEQTQFYNLSYFKNRPNNASLYVEMIDHLAKLTPCKLLRFKTRAMQYGLFHGVD